jgi:Family of unknown function (DUF5681)
MDMTLDEDKDARGGAIAGTGPDRPADPGTAVVAVPIANTSPMQTPSAERYPNRWRKGQSGNPNGRPLGSRHRTTLLAESLLDGQSEELIQKTIERALGGDTTALRICIDRIIAPRRDRPLSFRLPEINSAQDAVAAIGAITDGVDGGDLTPAEAAELAKVVEVFRSTIETAEFERRLTALEEAAKHK